MPAADGGMRVSVVLPAYNEEATIASVIAGCRQVLPQAEILVVDDGSTDATARRAEEAGARVVPVVPNRGKGHALRCGIERAEGDVLVFLDADGQDDPRDIPILLDAIAAGADLAIGSRFLGQFEPGAITTINRYGSQALNALVKILFGTRITDLLAGFRAVRRDLLEQVTLAADGYDIEADLLLQALRVRARVVEVPVRRRPRQHGASGLNPIVDGLRILGRVLRVRFQAAR